MGHRAILSDSPPPSGVLFFLGGCDCGMYYNGGRGVAAHTCASGKTAFRCRGISAFRAASHTCAWENAAFRSRGILSAHIG